ncbi:hypothetical protein MC885_018657 [Smutsia gigantea]|nr:hypothetical protein MC885_018657 [Smutsia gigantea]
MAVAAALARGRDAEARLQRPLPDTQTRPGSRDPPGQVVFIIIGRSFLRSSFFGGLRGGAGSSVWRRLCELPGYINNKMAPMWIISTVVMSRCASLMLASYYRRRDFHGTS